MEKNFIREIVCFSILTGRVLVYIPIIIIYTSWLCSKVYANKRELRITEKICLFCWSKWWAWDERMNIHQILSSREILMYNWRTQNQNLWEGSILEFNLKRWINWVHDRETLSWCHQQFNRDCQSALLLIILCCP